MLCLYGTAAKADYFYKLCTSYSYDESTGTTTETWTDWINAQFNVDATDKTNTLYQLLNTSNDTYDLTDVKGNTVTIKIDDIQGIGFQAGSQNNILQSSDRDALIKEGSVTHFIRPQIKVLDLSELGMTSFGGSYYLCWLTNMEEIRLPATNFEVTGEYTFGSCHNLKRVVTTEGSTKVTSVGKGAFENCNSLPKKELDKLLKYCTSIGEAAFINARSVSAIEVPVATTIGATAFKGATNALSISINPNADASSVSIDQSAFRDCTHALSLTIGKSGSDTSVKIGQYAFRGCTQLRDITCDSKITSLGAGAFIDNRMITSSSVNAMLSNYANNGGTTIPASLFYGCNGTKTIDVTASQFQTSITTDATAFGDGEGVANLIDGDYSTKMCATASTAPTITYQSKVKAVPTSYVIVSANDADDRDPKSWTLSGSTDGTNWTTLDTQTNQIFAKRHQLNSYSFSNTTPYNYFKLTITANNGSTGTQLAEFRIYGTAYGEENLMKNGGGVQTNSAKPFKASEGLERVIDGNSDSKFGCSDFKTKQSTTTRGIYIQYQSTVAANPTSYTLTSANDVQNRDPKAWTLYGSNDGSTWTTLDTQSAQTFSARKTTNTYTLSTSNTYTYYRLLITETYGDDDGKMQLADWAVYAAGDAVHCNFDEVDIPAAFGVIGGGAFGHTEGGHKYETLHSITVRKAAAPTFESNSSVDCGDRLAFQNVVPNHVTVVFADDAAGYSTSDRTGTGFKSYMASHPAAFDNEWNRLLTKDIYSTNTYYDAYPQQHAIVRLNRPLKAGWNTLCLPFAMNYAYGGAFGDNYAYSASNPDGEPVNIRIAQQALNASGGSDFMMAVYRGYNVDASIFRFLKYANYDTDPTTAFETFLVYMNATDVANSSNVYTFTNVDLNWKWTPDNGTPNTYSDYKNQYTVYPASTMAAQVYSQNGQLNTDVEPFKNGSNYDTYVLKGTFVQLTGVVGKEYTEMVYEGDKFVQQDNDGTAWCYDYEADTKYGMRGFSGWFHLQKGSSAKAGVFATEFVVLASDDEEATPIARLDADLNELPAQGAVYDLTGRRVADDTSALRSGMYIVNGKKVIIK